MFGSPHAPITNLKYSYLQ